ncbi:MAG: phenylacetate--CoA ligase family protein [Anaerolineae bacterium]
MISVTTSLRRLRMRLPLGVRTSYGWLRRRTVRHPVRDDPEFRRYYTALRTTEFSPLADLETLQVTALRALLAHAYTNVPYYRRVFDAHGVTPTDFTCLADLRRLPILTKEEVRANVEDMVATNFDRSHLRLVSTGGSTPPGPLSHYHDDTTVELHETAFMLRQWSAAGYRPGDRYATIKGPLGNRIDGSAPDAWYDYITENNEVMLSPFDMTEERMAEYVRLLRDFRPRFISAHPRSLEILARFMRRNAMPPLPLRAVFLESETITPWQRELVESQFACRVFAGYGLTERVVDATECPRHSGYHVSMEYGILELVDAAGDPVTEPGAPGFVVGTGFDTYCMPLIRYRTDDVAHGVAGECGCGRHSPRIDGIEGKTHQYIVANNGRIMPLFLGHPRCWDSIREWRFVQQRPGQLVAQVVLAPGRSQAEVSADLTRELFKRLRPDEFQLEVQFVDSLPRTHRGKLRLLEQALSLDMDNPNGTLPADDTPSQAAAGGGSSG